MFKTIIYTKTNARRREVMEELYSQVKPIFADGLIDISRLDWEIETPFFSVRAHVYNGMERERGCRCDLIVLDDDIVLTEEDKDFADHITHLSGNRYPVVYYRGHKHAPVEKFVGVENTENLALEYYKEDGRVKVGLEAKMDKTLNDFRSEFECKLDKLF